MRNIILAMAGLAVSGVAAAAEGPSWTYADASYWRGDSGEDDSEAYVLEGSFGFADKYHVQGQYLSGEQNPFSVLDDSEDFDGYRIKAGINPAVTDNTDFVFQVGYFDLSQELGSGAPDLDIDGYSLTLGLRSMFAEKVELFAYANVDVADLDAGRFDLSDEGIDDEATEISAIIGGQYFFTDNFSLSLRYEDGGIINDNAAQFGARWSF